MAELSALQRRAVECRDKTLLVSAAAGAGKTFTLTRRVIASLLDPERPADLERMLIITFTRASAADLKRKVAAALSEALAEDPGNARLARQTLALSVAQISTVDSFFFKLLREHADEVGCSPDVRIADEAERALLLGRLCDELIDECYGGECPEVCEADAFCDLAECLTSAKGEKKGLPELLLGFFGVCENYPGKARAVLAAVEATAADPGAPVGESVWGRYLADKVRDFAEAALRLTRERAEAAMAESELNGPGVRKCMEYDLGIWEELRAACAHGYTAMRRQIEACTAKPPSLSGKEKELPGLEAYRHTRKMLREKWLREDVSRFFAFPEEDWAALIGQTADLARRVCAFEAELDRRFAAEKARRHIVDYPDLEHKLFGLFYTGGEPNAAAASVAARYDYVYVDEYQDINRMQDAIIRAVSRPDNRFMVGDVKQSIYSFRRAEPQVFAHMKKTFPPLEGAGDSPAAALQLNVNYRSSGLVIDFINDVFDTVFGCVGEEIDYRESDRLVCGNGLPGTVAPRAVLVTCPSDGEEKTAPAPERDEADGEDGEDEEEDAFSSTVAEAEWVAAKIAALLSEEGEVTENGVTVTRPLLRPSDVCILLRKVKGRCEPFVRALASRGIRCAVQDERDFFLVPEVLLCLCLLNAVDNPRRDVYLAGAMQSPLWGFGQDDLTRMRLDAPADTPLWESVQTYAASHPEDTRVGAFLADIARWQVLAESIPTDRLIRRMMDETGLLSVAGQTGSGRENLLRLYQYARQFEGASFKGLHSFIDYLNQIIRAKKTLEAPKSTSEDPDEVRLMTIHSSKGLEFKVVFVCACDKKYNHKPGPLTFDEDLGLALPLPGPSGMTHLRTPLQRILWDRIRRAENAEEMRVFYVALTRAREQLYVTASAKVAEGERPKLLETADTIRLAGSRYAYLQAENPFLLTAAALGPERVETVRTDPTPKCEAAAEETREGHFDPALYERLDEAFGYRYPHAYLGKLPGKLAVSRLTPTVLDDAEDDAEDLPGVWKGGDSLPENDNYDVQSGMEAVGEKLTPAPSEPPKIPYKPAFLTLGEAEEADPAQRGTATHLFLQFCDFGELAEEGVEAELTRLGDKHFLSLSDVDLVRRDELEKFRTSALFAELRQIPPERLWREFRFHVRLPASEFTADPDLAARLEGEYVLVQGVMDCVFRDAQGGLCLLDYKTDRLSPAERRDPRLAAQKLLTRHAQQLKYYRRAVREIWGEEPTRVGVYSLPMGALFLEG